MKGGERMKRNDVFHSQPDIMSGAPVFNGTRVPAATLFHYLEAGDSLDVFLDHFPIVKKENAVKLLQLAREVLLDEVIESPV